MMKTESQRQAQRYLDAPVDAGNASTEAEGNRKLREHLDTLARDAGLLPEGKSLRDVPGRRDVVDDTSLREAFRFATGERSTNPRRGEGLLEQVLGNADAELIREAQR